MFSLIESALSGQESGGSRQSPRPAPRAKDPAVRSTPWCTCSLSGDAIGVGRCWAQPDRTGRGKGGTDRVRESQVLDPEKFDKGFLLVQKGVVNGPVGKVKTRTSKDRVPLDPTFAKILLKHKGDATGGLVFKSPVTGRCYYTGIIQRRILSRGTRASELLGWVGTPFGTPIVRSSTRWALRSERSRS